MLFIYQTSPHNPNAGIQPHNPHIDETPPKMYPDLSIVVNPLQLHLLRLTYRDLASRSKRNAITRDTFQTFFHVNGLWAQRMFLAFDRDREGTVQFEEFLEGIGVMVKGTFQERSRILFRFYDTDNSCGITYTQLLQMLYSYPKQQLKQMITDDEFVRTLDNAQLCRFFTLQKYIQEQNIMVEQSSHETSQLSIYSPEIILQTQETIKMDQRFQQNQETAHRLHNNNNNKPRRKRYKLTNNIALLAKKYVDYIFKSLKLDKNKQEVSFQNFLSILCQHQKIFTIYLQGFHTYIWMLQEDNQPEYVKIPPEAQSPCTEYNPQTHSRTQRYLKLIKTTLFIFEQSSSPFPLPVEIKNMQGLIVKEKNSNTGFGIAIKHPHGVYPIRQYYFQNSSVQRIWLDCLQEYNQNSIYNLYSLKQKIGYGSFSEVYLGMDKKRDKEVAIKVVNLTKLSKQQQKLIKSQRKYLQLCHHPNILKFFDHFQIKNRIFIITELLNEGNLYDYTKRYKFLQEYQSAIIFKKLIEAITYLHNDLRLIHRDLKPQNILLVMNKQKNLVERPVIIDLGFAVLIESLGNQFQSQYLGGTFGYMAPELLGDQEYDQSSDMFSLGVILYFMLCGQLPFGQVRNKQLIRRTRQCKLQLNTAHWTNISPQAKDLLSKLITHKHSRISNKQTLNHPWLRERNVANLRNYGGRNRKGSINE